MPVESGRAGGLPPTSPVLLLAATRPYFLWWLDMTVEEFRRALESGSGAERAYYLGALLREANTRDVWLFTTPSEIRAAWPLVVRHLGKTRERWAWLLDLPNIELRPDAVETRA